MDEGQTTSPGIPRQNNGQAPSRKQDSGAASSVLRSGSNPVRSQYPFLKPDSYPRRLTTPTKILRRCPFTVCKHRLELSRGDQPPTLPSLHLPPRARYPHISLEQPPHQFDAVSQPIPRTDSEPARLVNPASLPTAPQPSRFSYHLPSHRFLTKYTLWIVPFRI